MALVFLIASIYSCTHWDNFTTYFNTYYNMNRLLHESEDEFEFQDQNLREKPRVFIPEPDVYEVDKYDRGVPEFVQDYIISDRQRQPVNIKLDSIIIKGSKILANHPQSKYVQGSLFLMAKSYFYRKEWLPSQIKCSELIDKFTDGEFSPDAHLLYAKNLLIQRKFIPGKMMLSRTVDIAWQLKRYDILSEAFRLEAEWELYNSNLEGALRPYKQAIAQSDDNEMSARWQLDMALILYRMSKFERALKEFDKVHEYSPDYLAEYEAYLYKASTLNRLGKYKEADEILDDIENDGKYEEWKGYAFAERMHSLRLQGMTEDLDISEKYADSAFVNNKLITAYYFERAMDFYRDDNYRDAAKYFGRARTVRTSIFHTAHKMYKLMSDYIRNSDRGIVALNKANNADLTTDSLKNEAAYYIYELGRVHEQLGNADSARYYYGVAANISLPTNERSSRYMYAYARLMKDIDPYASDSLYEIVVDRYPKSEFGEDASKKLGFTNDFVIDTLAELFRSGSDLRRHGEFYFAINQFLKVYHRYPDSDLAPKSVYSVGWIYENELHVPDSAMMYYDTLLAKYPKSIYAEDIRMSHLYYSLVQKGEPIPDSLQKRQRAIVQTKRMFSKVDSGGPGPKMQQPPQGSDNLGPKDLLVNPNNLIKSGKDMLNAPLENLKDAKSVFDKFDIPDTPMDLFKGSDDNQEKKDTAKVNTVLPPE